MLKQYHSGEADLDNEEVDEEFHGNALDRGPFFEVSATKNITAIAGHSAYLNCRIRNLGNRTVSALFSEELSQSRLIWILSLIFINIYELFKLKGIMDPSPRFTSINCRKRDVHAGWAFSERSQCSQRWLEFKGMMRSFPAFWWNEPDMDKIMLSRRYSSAKTWGNDFDKISLSQVFSSTQFSAPSRIYIFLLKFIRKAFCLNLVLPLISLRAGSVILFTIIHKLQSNTIQSSTLHELLSQC